MGQREASECKGILNGVGGGHARTTFWGDRMRERNCIKPQGAPIKRKLGGKMKGVKGYTLSSLRHLISLSLTGRYLLLLHLILSKGIL